MECGHDRHDQEEDEEDAQLLDVTCPVEATATDARVGWRSRWCRRLRCSELFVHDEIRSDRGRLRGTVTSEDTQCSTPLSSDYTVTYRAGQGRNPGLGVAQKRDTRDMLPPSTKVR